MLRVVFPALMGHSSTGSKGHFMSGASIGLLLVLVLLSPTAAVAATNANAYVTNSSANTVSVINTTNNSLVATILGFHSPNGAAMTPDGTSVYVANSEAVPGTVSVINTATNTITATILSGSVPVAVAASPDGKHIYVTNQGDSTVAVINTATNTVSATVGIGGIPLGAVVTPDNAHVYLTLVSGKVAVVSTASNTVSATITDASLVLLGLLAITPAAKTVYASDFDDDYHDEIGNRTNHDNDNIRDRHSPFGPTERPV